MATDNAGPRYGAGADALYQLACDHGSARGCYSSALIHERGLGVPVDAARARALLERARSSFESQCRGGYAQSCYGEAELLRRGAQPDLVRARAAAEEGCNGSSGLACLLLWRLRAAEGVDAADAHTKAIARLGVECEVTQTACIELERERARTTPPAKPPPPRAPLPDHATLQFGGDQCISDPPDLCDRLPELFASWSGAAIDTLSVELDRNGCQRANEPSCFRLGVAEVTGTGGIARDPRQGFARIEHACKDGDALACDFYARAISDSLLGGREPKEAIPYHQRSCEMGNADACYTLGRAKFDGTGAAVRPSFSDAPDEVRDGVVLIERACTLDHAEACAHVGRIYFNGWYVPSDPQKGLARLRTACLIGGPDECEAERAYLGK